ncbi:hypothetical protein [Clostridium baratii]|uniref:Uncharacterized protein n=1 Tax=Clostridium baratii TaxID=1561 RepID=A0A174QW90_9CLOT|nr:hypothetical protein [Clostridium baratii]CUP75158.1 Uncharacterised protein [Clostridium baratii]
MRKKEITMTIKEFMNYTNGDIDLYKIDKLVCNMNKTNYKILVTAVATTLFILTKYNPVFAEGIAQVDKVGNQLLGIAQQVCYWICLIMGIKEIITELLKGDAIHNPSDIMRAIIKYAIAFASVYFMPYLFDMIKTMF